MIPSVSVLSRCERKQGETSLMHNNSISVLDLSCFLHEDLIVEFQRRYGTLQYLGK